MTPEPASGDSSTLSSRIADELIAWLKTLASAAVYATLIVTFGFQVARVEGQSMAPTLQDQDRLIVNKFAYRIGEPQIGDIVMLYYPSRPEKSFVKRVIAAEGDQVKIVDGRVYRNDVLMDDSFVPAEYRSHEDWGPRVIDEGYYFVMGDHRNNSSDSRHWGLRPQEVHHRPRAAALVAGAGRSSVLNRNAAVSRVLLRVFFLNLAVAGAKLVFGYSTGAVSIISDGFHSLTDSASNVMGLIAARAAQKPPDEDHPYGHRKYETIAAGGIFVFLLIALIEVMRAAVTGFAGSKVPQVSSLSFIVMLATLAVNLIVVRYESREARRLGSELLLADAMHTKSDVLTSCAVLMSLARGQAGRAAARSDRRTGDRVPSSRAPAGRSRVTRRRSCQTASRWAKKTSVASSCRCPKSSGVTRSVRAAPRTTSSWTCTSGSTARQRSTKRTASPTWSKTGFCRRYPEVADAIIHIEPPPQEMLKAEG